MSEERHFDDLGDRLRAQRPAPSSGLVSAIVARAPKRVQDHPRASLRLALAGVVTVALVTAVAAVGGVGYASKQVTHAIKSVGNSAIPAKSAGALYSGQPVIDNVIPQATCPGERIVIKGSHFHNTTSVTIGGIPARFKVNQDKKITAWVPKGFVGGSVTVTNPDGSATWNGTLKVRNKPPCS